MKYLFTVLLAGACLPAGSQTNAGNRFVLNGKVTNLQQGKIYLRYTNEAGTGIYDSTELQNGAFRFTGTLAHPVMAGLNGTMKARGMDDVNYTTLFLEPGTMQVTLADQDFKQAVVTGSAAHRQFAALTAQRQKIEKRWKIVMDTLHAVNTRSNTQYQEFKNWVLQPYMEEMNELQGTFIRQNPTSYVTAYLLSVSRNISTDSLQKLYAAFPAGVKQSSYGKNIAQELEQRKIGVPGTTAAAFRTTNIKGEPLQLADYKGKYVLIDFWASWCVPCRKGNPHLKELYSQYRDKGKGLEIIGISDDDRDTTAWKKAVAKDELPWQHVLRGLKMSTINGKMDIDRTNDITYRYHVGSLPTQILIDPNGIIIGRYGEGGEDHAALDAKLREVLY